MLTAVDLEKLKLLIRSHRSGNNAAFVEAAEAIILAQTASNHHATAVDLKRALGPPEMRDNQTKLNTLPRDRRNGEDLIFFDQTPIQAERLVFGESTSERICRLLAEHKNRARLLRYGYQPKSKLLFWGPPGCGKTAAARLVASELGLPLGVLRLSSVISSFVGDTAAHLQKVFTTASAVPMVLLIDEVDAVGKNRDDRNDVGELKRVVNSLLQAMDAFGTAQPSLLIAASNHQYLLDPALWRRFDDVIEFPIPEVGQRERMLKILLNGLKFDGSISRAARAMSSMSFAEIERAVIEAIKTMILEHREVLLWKDLQTEIDRRKTSASKARRRTGVRVK
jgi:SpoVK/Ycf46/Vps4 family AAA+-type ATPase